MTDPNFGEIIKQSLKDKYLKWILRIFALVTFVALIWGWIDYRTDIKDGKHAKFLWWERNIPKGKTDTVYNVTLSKTDTVRIIQTDTIKIIKYKNYSKSEKKKPDTIIVGKNINTGINNGHIGDEYNNERELEEGDKFPIIDWIKKVQKEKNVTSNCINVLTEKGSNAGKFISQLIDFLRSKGYEVSLSMAISYEQVKGLNFSASDNCVSIHVGTL